MSLRIQGVEAPEGINTAQGSGPDGLKIWRNREEVYVTDGSNGGVSRAEGKNKNRERTITPAGRAHLPLRGVVARRGVPGGFLGVGGGTSVSLRSAMPPFAPAAR